MELGAGFFVKLEPFLLMSKSAKGAAAAKLILDATGSPGVFVFGELLDVPSIQEVRILLQLQLQVKFTHSAFDTAIATRAVQWSLPSPPALRVWNI